jgi:hypothetical protein
VEPRTKFSFRVTRAHGFEAGEYDVVIKDGRSDQQIGTKQRVIFEGKNEVIDRRAMVFTAEKKKKEEPAAEQTTAPREYSPDDPAYWEGGPKEAEPKEDDRPPPAHMREGGCGCQVVGLPVNAGFGALLALPLLFALRRRRAAGI